MKKTKLVLALLVMFVGCSVQTFTSSTYSIDTDLFQKLQIWTVDQFDEPSSKVTYVNEELGIIKALIVLCEDCDGGSQSLTIELRVIGGNVDLEILPKVFGLGGQYLFNVKADEIKRSFEITFS